MQLREFKSGEFEAVVKVVKPMKQEMMEAAMADACTNTAWMNSFTRTNKDADIDEAEQAYKAQQNHNRAVRRAKQNIRWLCKVMQADRLFTLTYRENVVDREKVMADFKRFLRLVRSGWRGWAGIPDWQYVAVLEMQDRGAYHVHCAVRGFQRIKFLRAAWYKALGGDGFETGENTPGAVNVTNPDKARWGHTGREWKVNKLAGYLTKYLSKTFDSTSSEKKRYWHAKDLRGPEVQRMWIGGFSMNEAIKSAWSTLELSVGLTTDCSMWVSTQNDVFWIAGRGQ